MDNLEVIYCTMALLSVELLADDILIELLRLSLDIQVTTSAILLHLSRSTERYCSDWSLQMSVCMLSVCIQPVALIATFWF